MTTWKGHSDIAWWRKFSRLRGSSAVLYMNFTLTCCDNLARVINGLFLVSIYGPNIFCKAWFRIKSGLCTAIVCNCFQTKRPQTFLDVGPSWYSKTRWKPVWLSHVPRTFRAGTSIMFSCNLYQYVPICFTSSTTQGSGGSFKHRKPKGSVGLLSCMGGRASRWRINRWLDCRFLTAWQTGGLPCYLSICPVYLPDQSRYSSIIFL